jgi:endonuclease/exonuclease/phosphatase family metal-dependent hydrolase
MSSTAVAPITFTAMTLNVWGDHHGEQRRGALQRLLEVRPPDLLATQELRAWSRAIVDSALVDHSRVTDEFGGWEHQSNLWWSTALFEEIEHGADDVGILAPDARLFWVRLGVLGDSGRSLLFATAHLTWPGHEIERANGVNLRTGQARSIVARLDERADGSDVIFTTDINDIGGPVWELGNGGFCDSFSALERHSPPTHPVLPNPFADGIGTSRSPLASPAKAIDWIFLQGRIQARASEVVEFFHRGIAPSDHAPVVATITLRDNGAAASIQPQSTSQEEPT